MVDLWKCKRSGHGRLQASDMYIGQLFDGARFVIWDLGKDVCTTLYCQDVYAKCGSLQAVINMVECRLLSVGMFTKLREFKAKKPFEYFYSMASLTVGRKVSKCARCMESRKEKEEEHGKGGHLPGMREDGRHLVCSKILSVFLLHECKSEQDVEDWISDVELWIIGCNIEGFEARCKRCCCSTDASQVTRASVDITSLGMRQGMLDRGAIRFVIWDLGQDVCTTLYCQDVYAKCGSL
ncbi:hypothetical protein GOP47_0011295 [Adiantum capillus-veneris]|uniref:Uncharacterized protein n=1 Tax=Adiantum capillus-veneris TaxID=13818 RepID=A0A9D4ZGL1_ADICA|nr:hypothetical protein GOP47_0011295 [Adiantum capillus-veneris]